MASLTPRIDAIENKSIVKYANSASTPITGSTAILDFPTKIYDTKSEVSGSGTGWRFTAQASGYYRITAKVILLSGGAWTTAKYVQLVVYKNLVAVSIRDIYQQATHSVYVSESIESLVQLYVGDTLAIGIAQNTGTNINLHSDVNYNQIAIEQI